VKNPATLKDGKVVVVIVLTGEKKENVVSLSFISTESLKMYKHHGRL